jgi:hypothetical protein
LPDTAGVIEFLKRRYAGAIERGDDRTATRLRAEIDHLINGQSAAAQTWSPRRAGGGQPEQRSSNRRMTMTTSWGLTSEPGAGTGLQPPFRSPRSRAAGLCGRTVEVGRIVLAAEDGVDPPLCFCLGRWPQPVGSRRWGIEGSPRRWEPGPAAAQPMVGILNSAPARMPVGQREVTAFCLV